MDVLVEGVSHRGTPLEIRERVHLSGDGLASLLRRLAGRGDLSGAAVLSTCNRTELYVTSGDAERGLRTLADVTRSLDPSGDWERHRYRLAGEEALRHMFRVPSGLDSAIIGEGQILAQFKGALAQAHSAGSVDARLDFVMRSAISTAKRVRSETAIGRNPVGFGHAAVHQARAIFGSLGGRSALLLGAGKMAGTTARLLADAGIERLHFGTRTPSRAIELAAEMPAGVVTSTVPMGQALQLAAEVDMVICSTNSPAHVLTREMVEDFMRRRRHRPLFLLDLAVPRDIAPDAAEVEDAYLFNLDDLSRVVNLGLAERHAELPAAEAIVGEEVGRATLALAAHAAAPTISALVAEVEAQRQEQLRRGLPAGLSETQRNQVDRMTRALTARLLHGPIRHLREHPDDLAAATLIREMFGVDVQGTEGISE